MTTNLHRPYDLRTRRAYQLIAAGAIRRDHRGQWWVRSASGKGEYLVTPDEQISYPTTKRPCTCGDKQGQRTADGCKHQRALRKWRAALDTATAVYISGELECYQDRLVSYLTAGLPTEELADATFCLWLACQAVSRPATQLPHAA
jgi:hypothetical protein